MATEQPPAGHLQSGNVGVVAREDVFAAATRLQGRVRRTPVIRIAANELGQGHPPFWAKLESLQVTGAFKARGALNNLLSNPPPAAGVCTASGGNHGQAVAWAARQLGVSAAVFVPTTCPPIKLRRLCAYGANVTVVGSDYDTSLQSAQAYADRTGAVLVHPFDHALTVVGAGTVAAEFAEQVPELDTMLVAVGGGGLLAGALAALETTRTRVVGVEPSAARCLGAALDAHALVDVETSGVAVDSLGPRRVGQIAFAAAQRHHLKRVEVNDGAIRNAQLRGWEDLRVGLEGGGATALAALLSGAYQPRGDETVGVVCSGGNVDIAAVIAKSEFTEEVAGAHVALER